MTPKTIPTTDATETDPKKSVFISSGSTKMSGCTPKGKQLYVRDEFSKKINWSETIKCGVKTV